MQGTGIKISNTAQIKVQQEVSNKVKRESWQVRFNLDEDDLDNLRRVVVDIFNNLIDRVANDLNENNLIRVVIHHPPFDRPINLSIMTSNLDAERIITEIERVIQSNEDLNINEDFVVDLIKIHLPRGQGYSNRNLPIEVLFKKDL